MLYLASSSPRRKEILQSAGVEFVVVPSDGDESRPPKLSPAELVQELAKRKAFGAKVSAAPEDVILGADTLVALEDKVLGKPGSEEEAFAMLSELSGRTHTVYTGCCLRKGDSFRTLVVATEVEFYPLTEKEIWEYIHTGEPMDKAGAYGIQGRGCVLVKGIRGDYFNVVGLPAAEVLRSLREI